jgi:osmotically inducible protein OsmC
MPTRIAHTNWTGGSQLEVDAKVTLSPDPAGGFRIPRIDLLVREKVDGLDDAAFKKVAEEAKA